MKKYVLSALMAVALSSAAMAATALTGKCGDSAGATFSKMPLTNLCVRGQLVGKKETPTSYVWECLGVNGGAQAHCAAKRIIVVNGKCGSSEKATFTTPPASNLCLQGNATTIEQTATSYRWYCNGTNQGTNSLCAAVRKVGGSTVVTPTVPAAPSAGNPETLAYVNASPIIDAAPYKGFFQYIGTRWMRFGAAKPYSLQFARDFKNLWRFEVRSGDKDQDQYNTKPRDRSEIIALDYHVPYGQDIWQSYAMYIAPGTKQVVDTKLAADWLILGQWHGTADKGEMGLSPPFAIDYGNDTLTVKTAAVPEKVSTYWPTYTTRYSDPAFPRGKWVNFVMRTRFDYSGKGEFQLWINGKEVANAKNIALGYNDDVGPYYQFGIYRGREVAHPFTVYYANMEMSTSSLLSRVTAPLPIQAQASSNALPK